MVLSQRRSRWNAKNPWGRARVVTARQKVANRREAIQARAVPLGKRLDRLRRALGIDRISPEGAVTRRAIRFDQCCDVIAETPLPRTLRGVSSDVCLDTGDQGVQHIPSVKAVDPEEIPLLP